MLHHLSIDYDEDKAGSYRGIVLTAEGQPERRWNTGDPKADWASYLAYAQDNKIQVLEKSSITHFVFDNPEWRFILDDRGHEILVEEDREAWTNPEP
jgi:hypothetical protein